MGLFRNTVMMMIMCFRLLGVQWDGKSFVYMKAFFQGIALSKEDRFCSITWPVILHMNVKGVSESESVSVCVYCVSHFERYNSVELACSQHKSLWNILNRSACLMAFPG